MADKKKNEMTASLSEDVLANVLGGGPLDELIRLFTSDSRSQDIGPRRRTTPALAAMLGKAFQLEGVENQRHESALGRLLQEFETGEAGLDSRLFARESDLISSNSNMRMQALRSSLGGRGVGGLSGAALGIGAGLNLNRLNAITGARRDIAIDSAQRRFSKMFGIAQFEDQAPSLLGADALASLVNLRFGERGANEAKLAADKAAAATERAGYIGAGASLLGGLF